MSICFYLFNLFEYLIKWRVWGCIEFNSKMCFCSYKNVFTWLKSGVRTLATRVQFLSRMLYISKALQFMFAGLWIVFNVWKIEWVYLAGCKFCSKKVWNLFLVSMPSIIRYTACWSSWSNCEMILTFSETVLSSCTRL